jgi:hypothetical protein
LPKERNYFRFRIVIGGEERLWVSKETSRGRGSSDDKLGSGRHPILLGEGGGSEGEVVKRL